MADVLQTMSTWGNCITRNPKKNVRLLMEFGDWIACGSALFIFQWQTTIVGL